MVYKVTFTPYQGAVSTPAVGEFSVELDSSRLEDIESRIGKLLQSFQKRKGPILVTMIPNDEPFHTPEEVYYLVARHIERYPEKENHAVYYNFDSDNDISMADSADTVSSMAKKGPVCESCKNFCQLCIVEYAPRIRRDSFLFGGYALPGSKDEEVSRDSWISMTDSMFTIINKVTSKCEQMCGAVDIRKYVNHHLNNRNSALKRKKVSQKLLETMRREAEEWLKKYKAHRDHGRMATPSLAQKWAKEANGSALQISIESIGMHEMRECFLSCCENRHHYLSTASKTNENRTIYDVEDVTHPRRDAMIGRQGIGSNAKENKSRNVKEEIRKEENAAGKNGVHQQESAVKRKEEQERTWVANNKHKHQPPGSKRLKMHAFD